MTCDLPQDLEHLVRRATIYFNIYDFFTRGVTSPEIGENWDTLEPSYTKVKRVLCYPPGSKCEALRLGVHLILLYFIRISLLTRRFFFYFDVGVDVDVGGGLFLSLNLLIVIWYKV